MLQDQICRSSRTDPVIAAFAQVVGSSHVARGSSERELGHPSARPTGARPGRQMSPILRTPQPMTHPTTTQGDPIVTGSTDSPTFPTTPSAYDPQFHQSQGGFLTKPDSGQMCSGVAHPMLMAGGLSLHSWERSPLPGHGWLHFELPRSRRVTLAICDLSGRCVRGLLDQMLLQGAHRVSWNGYDNTGCELPSQVRRASLPDAAGGRLCAAEGRLT